MLNLPGPEDTQRALAVLTRAVVRADGRGRLLRLSPGNMTTAEGIDRAQAALQTHRAG